MSPLWWSPEGNGVLAPVTCQPGPGLQEVLHEKLAALFWNCFRHLQRSHQEGPRAWLLQLSPWKFERIVTAISLWFLYSMSDKSGPSVCTRQQAGPMGCWEQGGRGPASGELTFQQQRVA